MRLRGLIRRYSDHIGFPVRMRKEGEASLEYEVVNQAKALWTLPRAQVTDEEYRQFYQYLAHDFTDPLAWSHNKVEGKREYTSLLYLPARAPFDLWQRDAARGLKLYVRRVFIMDDAEQFLPLYLRFVKGVVDSGDLPLNVSRELLQQEPRGRSHPQRPHAARAGAARAPREGRGGEVRHLLEGIWRGAEGGHRAGSRQPGDRSCRCCALPAPTRPATPPPSASPTMSRACSPGRSASTTSSPRAWRPRAAAPPSSVCRERGLEVLLLAERIDEWVMGQLESFEGKRFKDASRGDLELGGLASAADRKQHDAELKESKGLLKRIKDALGERVTEVRVSERLKESPACLVLGEHDLSEQMRRILAATGQKVPDARPLLEVNVGHPLVKYLDGVADPAQFTELAQLLFEQAALAEGVSLSNPPDYVQRLNRLLVRLAAPGAPP